jgi:membrane-associated phospholipid phosphatase
VLSRPLPLFAVLLFLCAAPVEAQDAPIDTTVVAEDPPTTRDILLLHKIYNVEAPLFTSAMRGADWTSLRTFYSAAPALWLGTLLFDDERDFKPAYLLTLSEAGTVGAVFALKTIVKRPRPYASLSSISSRSRGYSEDDEVFDPHSFPSGHAATSFAIATSLSLSFPEWYVIAPAGLWASAVTISRPWLGVHYPTDIAVGAALGVGVAFAVHALGEIITPDALRGDADDEDALMARPAPPSVRFMIPIR